LSALVSRSPQAPHHVVAEAEPIRPSEVTRIAARARARGQEWAGLQGGARAAALRAAGDAMWTARRELEDLVVTEVGKPRVEARGEVERAVAIVHYYAQRALDPLGETYPPAQPGLLYTHRRPRGVAGLITPWNFPLAIPVWKAAPALAAGNAVLLKPSTQALGIARALTDILQASLPEDLVHMVPGERVTAEAVIAASDVVSFTGSDAVGRSVALAATRAGIPVQAEMGGQNAALVLPDADPAATARTLVAAATAFAGQKCTATRRIITVGDPSVLADALTAEWEAAAPADPSEETTTVGPVISAQARATVLDAAAEAQRSGARIARPADKSHDGGWFVPPALVFGLDPGHRLLQEETFGPIAAVVRARDADEAVRITNGVRHGLVASVHGRDLGEVLDVVGRLDCGLVKVNAPTTGVDYYVPFGGDGDSSIGPREQGRTALDFYSSTQTVTLGI
jgi:aldehyde dehydrogenase (NAD+)